MTTDNKYLNKAKDSEQFVLARPGKVDAALLCTLISIAEELHETNRLLKMVISADYEGEVGFIRLMKD